ncbi:MAG TPA: hypothetical protein H9871_11440 [Candidatus Nesterenkonia stercoripullorum]|uniref:histidine kinase n=1 Tax=Candidatus Nesterenkonia stercoripullorum TaxID=2838701 RepID=A0A9D1UUQ0_9MICC|nr:hypothetical protein [Candidatus Nesterenkonia stercoripullorum]
MLDTSVGSGKTAGQLRSRPSASFHRRRLVALGALLPVGALSLAAYWLARRCAQDEERLMQHTAQVLQQERERIANELHNVVAHDLTVVTMHARALELTLSPAERRRSLRAISTSASEALQGIRRMLHIVHDDEPTTPAAENITAHLRTLAEKLEALGIPAVLNAPSHPVMSADVAAALRQIANECVTNILKHAPGTPDVRITLALTPLAVEFTAWNAPSHDDGVPPPHPSGTGLGRIAAQAEQLGGNATAGPEDGGWSVSVRLGRKETKVAIHQGSPGV